MRHRAGKEGEERELPRSAKEWSQIFDQIPIMNMIIYRKKKKTLDEIDIR